MRGHCTRTVRTPLGVMLVLGLAACASVSWAQDRGACVTANVPEPFVLPDGTLHAPGRITVCTQQVLNPVTGLHRMQVGDGACVMAMSRRSHAEARGDTRPVLLFRRTEGDPLEFIGYVLPHDRQSWSYSLQRSGPNAFEHPAIFAGERPKGELVSLLADGAN